MLEDERWKCKVRMKEVKGEMRAQRENEGIDKELKKSGRKRDIEITIKKGTKEGKVK